ncbi:MAG: hypothetical protein DCC56_05640 [Anaerolineae bacterium]|nr:MAG: hypothetical protein DCC56_05640 [Anaerolineae bacterium]WKZ43663.1 MAG: hypothetical protein QY302_16335 [Anaerolineales bacterium]
MSKPVTRIVFSALVVLILVVGVYFTVQAASSQASLGGERVVTTAGLMPDTQHVRSSFSGLSTFDLQSGSYQDSYQDSGHGGCDHDSPDD